MYLKVEGDSMYLDTSPPYHHLNTHSLEGVKITRVIITNNIIHNNNILASPMAEEGDRTSLLVGIGFVTGAGTTSLQRRLII